MSELVPFCVVTDLGESLQILKKEGYRIFALESDHAVPLSSVKFPEDGKIVILLGAEKDGIGFRALALADQQVAIPGTGAVESLNVSVVAAIVLWEWRRSSKR